MSRTPKISPALLAAAIALSFLPAGCFGHKKIAAAKTPDSQNAEPDKILYDRALNDYQHGRYTESRLALQTLINSYPDSEYLAKAKLAVADSYYKEGGVEGLTQAVAEYKDFITFFPFLPEASYAQMQVGMAHYRMMGKPDRDATQAHLAEQEFQTFLLTYPKSPLLPTAEQRLREVQEVLAEADFDVAHFYYVKGDYRASAARLIEVTQRYPLFSQSDQALSMLGEIYRRAAKGAKNEQERAKLREQSDTEYAQILKEYPLSSLAPEAKRQLSQDGVAIPKPDPQAVARAEYDQKYGHLHMGMFTRVMGAVKSSPNVSMAARSGQPDLNPPGETNAPQSEAQGAESAAQNGSAVGGSGGQNVTIQPVTPGESSSARPTGLPAVPESQDPPSKSANGTSANSSSTPPVASAPTAAQNAPRAADRAAGQPTATDAAAAAMSKSDAAAATADNGKSAKGKKAKAPKVNGGKESSSKRKKGLRKLIPW
ncbi:MAG TPA: outer membrane protein assembly factor BamD [Candidatus Acidoferrales bacterium]|nr:outer membrane protein assembly factor BamD [Candidatus Acidoferrales bacterium]